MTEEVFVNDRNSGYMINKEVYVSIRNYTHYFRKFQGFGMSVAVLKLLEKRNVQFIQIDYIGKEKIKSFLSSLHQWKTIAHNWDFKTATSIDPQKVLPVKDMILIDEKLIPLRRKQNENDKGQIN